MENDEDKKKSPIEMVALSGKDRSKEKSKEISTRELIHWFKFYVLPIVSIAILIIILVVGIFPNVNMLFGYLNQLEQLRQQSAGLDGRIGILKQLEQNSSRTAAYLTLIEEIVPEKQTEVVNFQEKIKNLGISKNLKLMEAKAGETIIVPEDLKEGDYIGIGLIEVPSQFSFQGNLENIKSFLTELNKGEDFLVINQMELTSVNSVVANQWTLDITFVKYQFQGLSQSQKSIFTEISEVSEPDKEVLDFIKGKYGDNNPLLNF